MNNMLVTLFFPNQPTKIIFLSVVLFLLCGDCLCSCKLSEHSDDQKTKAREVMLLEKIRPLYGKTFKDNDGKYDYHVTICDRVDGRKDNVGAVQLENKTERSLGSFDQADIMGGTNWIMLTYLNGEIYHGHCNASERQTQIMIICDKDQETGDFSLLAEKRKTNISECSYWFELGSSVACTEPPPQGMSSGGIFCVIFFTFALAYIVLGVLYKRLVEGAKGVDQIPNYSFWRSFGNLQADACDFICRCGPRHESQAYRGIDDRLKTDEPDDQLLNM